MIRHFAVDTGARFTCVVCRGSVVKDRKELATAWLSSKCTGHRVRDLPLGTVVQVGKHTTHHTHQLVNMRGISLCRKCGYYTTSRRLAKLAFPCEPPSKHQITIRDNLLSGKLPPNCTGWPTG